MWFFFIFGLSPLMIKAPFISESGSFYTKSLFKETSETNMRERRPIDFVFSLYKDVPGLINAQKTFVELEDPTGYKWSQLYLKSWAHWQVLMKAKWFQEAYEIWMIELTARMKSKAIDQIKAMAADDETPPAQRLGAAKYIAEEAWTKNTRGRPSKEEVTGELKKAVKVLTAEDEDMARIGLKVIHGGKNS